MTIEQATEVAGTLSRTTKMPGYSYNLDARHCVTGSRLVDVPESACWGCYAMTGFYPSPWVREAQAKRLQSLGDPRWVDAMTRLISYHCGGRRERFFRWHDSGDVQSVDHLAKIVEVARRTSFVRHWLPTREREFVAAYLRRARGKIPGNLVIRISARMVNRPPEDEVTYELAGLPTSTIHHHGDPPVQVSGRRNDSVACRALERGHKCGPCRACWSPDVRNVSYPLIGAEARVESRARRSNQLRLFVENFGQTLDSAIEAAKAKAFP